jgi:hypothetical protein
MNGTYAPDEERQKVTLTFEFKTKHSPGTEEHLRQLLQSHFRMHNMWMRDDGVVEV